MVRSYHPGQLTRLGWDRMPGDRMPRATGRRRWTKNARRAPSCKSRVRFGTKNQSRAPSCTSEHRQLKRYRVNIQAKWAEIERAGTRKRPSFHCTRGHTSAFSSRTGRGICTRGHTSAFSSTEPMPRGARPLPHVLQALPPHSSLVNWPGLSKPAIPSESLPRRDAPATDKCLLYSRFLRI